MRRPPPPSCAICGEDIPPKAHACPGCGADERNGWREQDHLDGIDLPEENAPTSPRHRWPWQAVVCALLAVILMWTWLAF